MPYKTETFRQDFVFREGGQLYPPASRVDDDVVVASAPKVYFERSGTNRNTDFGTKPIGASPSKAWPKQYHYVVYEKIRWKKVILGYRTHTRRYVYGWFWPPHLDTPLKRAKARRITPLPVRKVRRLVTTYLVRLETPKPIRGRQLVSIKKIKRRRLFLAKKPSYSLSTRKELAPNDLNFRKTTVFLSPPRPYSFTRNRTIFGPNGPETVTDVVSGRANPCYWAAPSSVIGGYNFLSNIDTTGFINLFNDEAQVQRLREGALSRLYSKLRDQNVNLAVALAEGGPTLKMFKSIVIALAKVISGMKKGDIFAFSRLTPKDSKEIANLHLANTYGLSPFLDDLNGFVKHLATRGAVPDLKIGTAAFTEGVYGTPINDPPSHVSFASTGVVTTYHKMKCRCSVEFRIEDAKLQELAQLGFANPEAVAWELIPFSFIIDWFIRIGDYLTNWNAADHIKVLNYYETYVQLDTSFWDLKLEAPSGWTLEQECQGIARIKSVRVQRFCFDTLPPMPKPRFKNPLSLGHFVNALALLRQVFR